MVASCSTAIVDAERELGWSRDAHGALVESEQELVESTASRIKGVDLDDLKDPNRLMQLASGVGGFFTDLAENVVVGVVELVQALANGDFMDAVWRLSELLDAVLDVLTIVAVVVAVVTTGGALGVVLVGLSLAAMASKLTADTVLAGTQHPHPDTGQPKTWGQVVVDAALLAVTGGHVSSRQASVPGRSARVRSRRLPTAPSLETSGTCCGRLQRPGGAACTGRLQRRA